MSGSNLVPDRNAFSEIDVAELLENTDQDVSLNEIYSVLKSIEKQLKLNNLYFAEWTGDEFTKGDLQ